MLTLFDGKRRISRREFLTIGSLGLGGLSLANLFAARAEAEESSQLVTGKSVIFLFQQGGPSQFETFDPKPHAPDNIRTVTGTVQTRLPGVIFGDKLPRLAAMADELTVVRSFQTNNGGHNIQPIVGPDSLEANIGSLYSSVVGSTRADTGMPTNAVIFPQAVDNDITVGRARGNIAATGPLGAIHAPFIPGGRGQLQQDMSLNLPRDRFDNRRQILRQLDALRRQLDNSGRIENMDDIRQQAYRVLTGGNVANALDLSREDPRTVARYDTSRFAAADGWRKVNRGRRGYYTGHARSLGKLLLLARRLCEAGCGFVTIHAGYDGVWDMHADGNNLNMRDGMEALGPTFDHAVAAFIEDVKARGLTDKILLVATGEMGRTPRINRRGGRDHWGRLTPLLLHGGGIRSGQVIGRSSANGGEPATDNQTPKNLIATILHTMFDPGILRITPGIPQIVRLSEERPIPGVFTPK